LFTTGNMRGINDLSQGRNEDPPVGSLGLAQTERQLNSIVLKPVRHVLVMLPGDEKSEHHLAVFKKPIKEVVKIQTITCDFLNWVPRRGNVKTWKWMFYGDIPELGCFEIGLLVPGTCWDWYWWTRTEEEKLNSLSLLADPYRGPVAKH
jgi:hypothetical protein